MRLSIRTELQDKKSRNLAQASTDVDGGYRRLSDATNPGEQGGLWQKRYRVRSTPGQERGKRLLTGQVLPQQVSGLPPRCALQNPQRT